MINLPFLDSHRGSRGKSSLTKAGIMLGAPGLAFSPLTALVHGGRLVSGRGVDCVVLALRRCVYPSSGSAEGEEYGRKEGRKDREGGQGLDRSLLPSAARDTLCLGDVLGAGTSLTQGFLETGVQDHATITTAHQRQEWQDVLESWFSLAASACVSMSVPP